MSPDASGLRWIAGSGSITSRTNNVASPPPTQTFALSIPISFSAAFALWSRAAGCRTPRRHRLLPLPSEKPRRKDVVSRCKGWIAVMAILIIATALAAVVSPQKAEAATLKGKLHHAKLALRTSEDRLQAAQAALAAAVAADPGLATSATAQPAAAPTPTSTVTPTPTPTATPSPAGPTVAQLQAQVAKARHEVRVWNLRVRRLARQYRQERQMASWEKHHQWMAIIKVAAAQYHVKADGHAAKVLEELQG